ncbi:MAG TPA: DNA repair protein [Marinobacter sp.]|jgi:hypothetical protein|nr:DNA repair protein [Marinobacter sp.]
MKSSGDSGDQYSAVFLMDGVEVSRQMRASEFEAFLDGYVGLSDLADSDVRAVYLQIGEDLSIRALVFFHIWFDEEGRADSQWNVPIEVLARAGSKGPDLGSGPIRLVCRSQCPDPRYSEDLWDPDMTPGSNHFQSIRKAVEANPLKFRKKEPEEDIPVLKKEAASTAPPPDIHADRARLAQVIREHRLRIKTLQSVHRDAMAELHRDHRVELKALRNEMHELEQRYERQRLSNEQLKRRLAERNEQYLTLQERLGNESADISESKNAEVVLLREQLERRQRELEVRDEKIIQLEQELNGLKDRKPPEESLMGQLSKQAVFLVAYHPGIGHITLPYQDIETYFTNPVSYAANWCGLNEPAYRQWLDHYEHPVCRAKKADGRPCGEPVMRVSQPADFVPGRDDRCEAHQS